MARRGAHDRCRCCGRSYKETHAEGLQYSRFCEQYRAWAGKLDLVMRQEHRAGEKLFVDYAGQTVPVVDRETGGERQAQIFVAVLGASSYTFAEATWTQTLPDWTASHVSPASTPSDATAPRSRAPPTGRGHRPRLPRLSPHPNERRRPLPA